MKRITELNSKVWYRLLKVIYVLIFIPIFILAFFAGYFSTEPKFDNEESYIKCDNGSKIKGTSSYISSDQDKIFKVMCLDDTNDIKIGEILTKEEFLEKYAKVKNEGISKNYELISVYEERDWIKAIFYSLASVVGIFILFEVIKRIFYYIVLGSFRPQK